MKQAIHSSPGLRVTVNYSTGDDFKEADHPRAKDGKFGQGGVEVQKKAPTGSPQYNPATTAKANPKFAVGLGHKSSSELKKHGPQLGSNPGGTYKNDKGEKFYVKKAKSEAHAANEVLAGHLYVSAGTPIVNAHRIDHDGGHGTVSKWAEHEAKFDPKNEDMRSEVAKNFAVHAWLANWDAIGLDNDNQVKIDGKMHLVDAGGSMQFRAQGGKKEFGPEVGELKTLKDPKLNARAAAVFGKMTPEETTKSAGKIAHIPDNAIRANVNRHLNGSADQKAKFADILIARKNYILKALGYAAK